MTRLERIETAVLVLVQAEVERQHLAERGEKEGWEAASRRVALRLCTERPVSGDAAQPLLPINSARPRLKYQARGDHRRKKPYQRR